MAKRTRRKRKRTEPAVAEMKRSREKSRQNYFLSLLLFMICFSAYTSNGDFLHGTDQEGNMLFSVNLLKRQSLSVTLADAPASFYWKLERPGEEARKIKLDEWNREQYEQGVLKPYSYLHYLANTKYPGIYVNTFGIGTAIVGLPIYAVLDRFANIETDRYLWWHGGALTAALLTASAALLIFLTARRFVAPLPAFLIALSFGLGSLAWPVSSQALWQHPANIFFLSLGAFFFLSAPERWRCAAYCGAAIGMAALCRPPGALVAVCIGVWLLGTDRRRLLAFVAGGLPFAILMAAYNGYYFGNPFEFGQTAVSRVLAEYLTGVANVWAGPLLESLPGIFISPQRGLAFYSPVLLFGFVGMALSWRDARYRPLIPLQVSALALIVVAAKWYDWWGGSAWGYRSIVDTVPFLALSMIPVIERVFADRRALTLFGALLLWSAAVQFVGAWSYNSVGWVNQWKEHHDPDKASLWEWTRPQIIWHVANFGSQRALKHAVMRDYVENPMPILDLSTAK